MRSPSSAAAATLAAASHARPPSAAQAIIAADRKEFFMVSPFKTGSVMTLVLVFTGDCSSWWYCEATTNRVVSIRLTRREASVGTWQCLPEQEVVFRSVTHCVVDQHVMGGVTSPPSAQARRSRAQRLAEAYASQGRPA